MRDVPEPLELVEEAFNEVAFFVGPPGVGDGVGPVGFRRNAGPAVLVVDDVADPIGIIGAVGEDDSTLRQIGTGR